MLESNNLKKLLLISTIILFAFSLNAQSNNYLIKMDGTRVEMYGDNIRYTTNWIFYLDENGKKQSTKDENIKFLRFGDNVMINLPNFPNSRSNSMHNIVAFNDKYILTGFIGDVDYLNILDREFNFVNKEKITLLPGSLKRNIEKRKEEYTNNVLSYFKDCPKLNEAIFKNIESNYATHREINYYNCNNAPDVFTNKVNKSENKTTESNHELIQENFYVDNNGEKHVLGSCTLIELSTVLKVSFGRKITTIPSTDLKYAILENKIYSPIMIEGKKHMVELIAFNQEYVLYQKTKSILAIYVGVYDRNTNLVKNEIKLKDDLLPLLNNYFKSCNDLKEMVDNNQKNHRSSVNGIRYYNCENAKELIEGIKF